MGSSSRLVGRVSELIGDQKVVGEVSTRFGRWLNDLRMIREMPMVTINLMLKRTADNHAFFRGLVEQQYREATGPHPVYRVISALKWGVAVCVLPRTHDDYFGFIEASARRNVKKARRKGYRCELFTITEEWTEGVEEIHRSTDVRQGKVPAELLNAKINPCTNPPSRSHFHAYPYWGVFLENKLVAYATALIAGEVCSIECVFGHADYHSDGVVPLMLVSMAETLYKEHPAVRYYVYGTYFGAGETMRRFKRRFRFFPHRVDWRLDVRETAD